MNPAGHDESYVQSVPEPIPMEPAIESAPPIEPPIETTPPARINRTRAGSVWASLSVGGVFLVVLLIFVVQNTTSTRIGFLGWHFALPVGVTILVAAVVGLLVMAIAGGVRIIQLRTAFTRLARGHKPGALHD
ncbi:MAG: putative integral rane protein [Nocardia sp.]|uniref:LapA family protein n=1 Tax=Nocardia sp. TaxID=1821 RepID=UPI0026084FF4|nr:lipopolysaccharide assembly protein LapA domain-containing protein [Nocardia sp.]MCU1641271.1 putative integral rane protein [Nocardia sp.]